MEDECVKDPYLPHTATGLCYMTGRKMKKDSEGQPLNQTYPLRVPRPSKGAKPYNSGISLLLVYISKREKKNPFLSRKNY